MNGLHQNLWKPIEESLTPGRAGRQISTAGIFLFLILLLGAILRFAALDRWSLWTDELHTIAMAKAIGDLHEQGAPDQHPPLYHLMMSQLVPISTDEGWLRLPSALSGLLAIALAYKTGLALGNRRFALLAAALVAFSPLLIWYSREARMYGLATGFWAASIYFYVQSFRRGSWADSVGLAAATLAALLTTYSSFALWFGEMALFVLFWHFSGRGARRLMGWLGAQAAIALGFSVWLPFMLEQLERSRTFRWRLPVITISMDLAQTFGAAVVAGGLLILLSLLTSLFVVNRERLLGHLTKRAHWAAWLLAAGYFVVLILGAIPRGLSIRRQLLVFLLPQILITAWGLVHLRRRRLTVILVTLSLALSGYTFFSQPFEDWRGVANYLAEHDKLGEPLLIYPRWNRNEVRHYYPGDFSEKQVYAARDWPAGEEPPFEAGSVVWVVINDFPAAAADTGPLLARFDRVGELLDREHFPTYLEVRRYRIR